MKKEIFSKSNLIKLAGFICSFIIMAIFLETIMMKAIPILLGLLVVIGIIIIVKKKDSKKIIKTLLFTFISTFLLALALSLALPMLGINFDFKVKEKLTAEEVGTPRESILNDGWISETDKYIFYINPNSRELSPGVFQNKLIRRKLDWTERIELTDSLVSYFVVNEDWIYYVDASEGNRLYQMKHDGSDKSLIIDERVYACAVSDESIFYSTVGGLYKMNMDGTDKTKLQSKIGHPIIMGDWVYYYDNNNQSLSRIKKDGTMDHLLISDFHDYYLGDEYLYFMKMAEQSDGYGFQLKIYQKKYDDTEAMEIKTIEDVIFAKFNDGYLYYQLLKDDDRLEKGLYRMNLDGSETVRVNKVMIWQLDSILGDWMYILQYSGHRYRIKLDGSVGLRFEQ